MGLLEVSEKVKVLRVGLAAKGKPYRMNVLIGQHKFSYNLLLKVHKVCVDA